MKEIKTVEEFEEVIASDTLTVVDFWASWCGPCKVFIPVFEEVAEQVGPLANMVKVSIEEVPQLASTYKIRTIPTVMFFKGGELLQTHIGSMPGDALRALIEENSE